LGEGSEDRLQHRHCIIPATGFYEWQPLETGKKRPWYFESTDGQAFIIRFGICM
jgi:putative SOS response-associated peptidase YedK